MARVIFSTRSGITADWENAAPMQAFLVNAWRQHCSGGIPATDGGIGQYSRVATTQALARLLEKVIEYE